MKSGLNIALIRISKDIKEIDKNPLEGIGIASINDDVMTYVVNMKLLNGIYEGYCLQLLLTFNENYPTKPPKILIFPNQLIDNSYHNHIYPENYTFYDDNKGFKKFCFDLLDNDFLKTTEEGTGWNPAYTIRTLLLQVQNFIADPDLPQHLLPNKSKIDKLMNSMNDYKREFNVSTEKGKIIKIHTWKNPYPEMYFKNDINNQNIIKEESTKKLEKIKENLTCFMLKVNYIDDKNILLGYPIIKKKLAKKKIELHPIPELLTYEGFVEQFEKQSGKLDTYFNKKFKSANNKYYNYWMPIYIDKNHYEKNKKTILNAFSVIKFNKSDDFKSEYIFEIMPIILNKMIIGMFTGQSTISSSFIICYFHFILLFKKLCEEFKKDYYKYLQKIIKKIEDRDYDIRKTFVPDIGNFLMLLIFYEEDKNSEKSKKLWKCILDEFLVRQMNKIFHGNETRENMKKLLLKGPYLNDKCLKLFRSDYNFKMIDQNKFINDLKRKEVYDKLKKILEDENLENTNIGLNSFKDIYLKCSFTAKNEIDELIKNELDFADYFNIDYGKNNKIVKLYDKLEVNEILENYKKEITNWDEILKYAYETQRGNKLLLISHFAKEKMQEKNFLEDLEKNYGIYLDVDNFIKELKQKLKEITNPLELRKYLGFPVSENISNYDMIKEAYIQAKRKGYLFTPPQKQKNEENLLVFSD